MLCIECGETREKEFYSNNRVRCKKCSIRRSIEVYHRRRRHKQAEYYREWYQQNGRNRAIDYVSNILLWQKAHPEAVKARWILKNHIKNEIIHRPPKCSLCSRVAKIQAHHKDYSKPLEVIWICASCHKKIHLGEEMNVRSY